MQISLPQQQMPTSPPPSTVKKKKTGLVLALTVVLAIAVGLTLAWLTASDTKHNVFEFGDVDIDLIEPEWDKNADKDITLPDGTPAKTKTGVYPGMETPKDPTIVNNGSAEAWVYISVEVPCLDDGTPVFHWDKINDGWVLDDETKNANGNMVYTFIYTSPLPGKKGDTSSQTPPVFDKVIINGELSNDDVAQLKSWYPNGIDLVVNGLGIQKEGLGAATAKEALEAYYGESAAIILDLDDSEKVVPTSNFLNTEIEPLLMSSYGEVQESAYALIFVRENLSGIPDVGDRLEGYKVLAVYKGIDNLPYYSQDELYTEDADTDAMLNEMVPWAQYMSDIYVVGTIDPIAPKNTSYWFVGLPHYANNIKAEWYLPHLDTTQTVHMDNMYANKQPAYNIAAASLGLTAQFGLKTVFRPECGINDLVYDDYFVQKSTLNYWGRECTVEGQYMGIDFATAYNDNPRQMSEDIYGLFQILPS